MSDDGDEHDPTEEDQAKITPLFLPADKFGNILWYNEDEYLRTEEMQHEQVYQVIYNNNNNLFFFFLFLFWE